MPYAKGFVETDDVDWWFLRSSSSVVIFMVSPAGCLHFYRFRQVPSGLWVHSGGGLWPSGDVRGTSPGFI